MSLIFMERDAPKAHGACCKNPDYTHWPCATAYDSPNPPSVFSLDTSSHCCGRL